MKFPKKTLGTRILMQITNTDRKHPGLTLPGLPVGLTVGPSAVLAQEAQGTREVAAANGAKLPMDGTSHPSDQLNCNRVGIKLGRPVDGDPLFRHAELPAGWRTEPSSEDSRTTNILDAKGNTRGYIWYKAASYDRRANMYLLRRYDVMPDFLDIDFKTGRGDGTRRRFVVEDRMKGEVVWRGEIFSRPQGADPQEWQTFERMEVGARKAAYAWLVASYPDHENVAAYWEAP